MERLSGLDASFLYLETPSLHMHVGLVLVFDPSSVPGGYSFERVKQSIEARTPAAPVFRRRLQEVPLRLGHPVWVDDPDFDIDYHVRRAAVPDPGGLEQLAELAGDISGRPLDRSRPLWEMWFVEGLANGHIGCVAKMHHSTVDGVAGAALLGVLFDLVPDPPPDVVPSRSTTEARVPSGLELAGQAAWDRARRPMEMARALVRTGPRLFDVRRLRQALGQVTPRGRAALPLSAPRTSFNGAVSWRRSVALTSWGLDDVKRVRRATRTTVNDVVLAVCTGALRAFLMAGDELPDKPLVAVVPVSVRSETPGGRGSNQLSTLFVQLPVELDDPIERLHAIHEGTRGAKEEHEALGSDTLITWAEYTTPHVFTAAARLYTSMRLAERHRPIANLVVSSFPGPDIPLYLAGAELVAGFPLGPVMDGMGVNLTVMSYRGAMYCGLHASPDVMPRLWDLAVALPTALDELVAAAENAPLHHPLDPTSRRPGAPSPTGPGFGRTRPPGGRRTAGMWAMP